MKGLAKLHVDFETRSAIDLKKTGVYVYAEDASTDILCLAYAFDDEPVELWLPGQPVPARIAAHVAAGGECYAHNASFERVLWKNVLTPRYGFPEPETKQWRCTMVMAYAMALPGSLADAASALNIGLSKDAIGQRLMLQLAKPRRVEADGTIVWWDDKEKLNRLYAYCRQDVEVERAIDERLRPLSETELALWHLDQEINDRGVLVDEELCTAASAVVASAQKEIGTQIRELTGGAVSSYTSVGQLIAWVNEQGVYCDTLRREALDTLLEETNDLPDDVRAVLQLRSEASLSSVSKIDALMRGRSADGRAKGLLQFHAATTGRWGGRRFQPQNLRRPKEEDVDAVVEVVLTGDAGYVALMYGKPISAVADTLRGMICADAGHVIVAADYSNIEGRVLAWLAGQTDKLDAFLQFDAGQGEDLYKITAGAILGKSPKDVTKDERQVYGKVPELACGYGGSFGAFAKMGAAYGVYLPDDQVKDIVSGWRDANDHIRRFWGALEDAAISAVKNPGIVTAAGPIKFKIGGSFLFMRLPSGRLLAYPCPEVRSVTMPWVDRNGEPVQKDSLTYFTTIDATKRKKVVPDPANTAKWSRIKTYGGMLAENATQAAARDVMADAMPRLEAAGFRVILTVHDEIVCEAIPREGLVADMERVMTDAPAWAKGLPLSVEGFSGTRYKK